MIKRHARIARIWKCGKWSQFIGLCGRYYTLTCEYMSFLGFENGFGAWKNALYEAYDFSLHQGPTSSAFTGPSTDARGDKKGRGGFFKYQFEHIGGKFPLLGNNCNVWKKFSMLANHLSGIFFGAK